MRIVSFATVFLACASILSSCSLVAAQVMYSKPYKLTGVGTSAGRSRVARTGAAIEDIGANYVVVYATPEEHKDLQLLSARDGFTMEEVSETNGPQPQGNPDMLDFPSGYKEYNNYTEMVSLVQATASKYSSIVSLFSIGKTYEQRDIWAAKISSNPRVDEDKPEVLFVGNHHAREHVTTEMTLYLFDILTSEYATNTTIKNLVDSLEIFIVFQLNPDGSEYDLTTPDFLKWRKNTQPNRNGGKGVDLNRNYGYRWGCCGGSSGSPSSETYRGDSAFSGVEARVMKDFIDSRVIGGKQQIRTAISFHSFSELILWPYGYTTKRSPSDMNPDDYRVFETMGRAMAKTNGYKPMQASELYVADGVWDDWVYGVHKIIGFTFELSPKGGAFVGNGGFYPVGAKIKQIVTNNREAVLYLLANSDCPYKVIGKTC